MVGKNGKTEKNAEAPRFVRVPKMYATHTERKGRFGGTVFRRAVELEGPLVYDSRVFGGRIIVPGGYVSDGASVPRWFWSVFPPFGKYLESSVVHDILCDMGKEGVGPADHVLSAEVFREAMSVQGVKPFKRNIMFLAVKWFGPKFDKKVFPGKDGG